MRQLFFLFVLLVGSLSLIQGQSEKKKDYQRQYDSLIIKIKELPEENSRADFLKSIEKGRAEADSTFKAISSLEVLLTELDEKGQTEESGEYEQTYDSLTMLEGKAKLYLEALLLEYQEYVASATVETDEKEPDTALLGQSKDTVANNPVGTTKSGEGATQDGEKRTNGVVGPDRNTDLQNAENRSTREEDEPNDSTDLVQTSADSLAMAIDTTLTINKNELKALMGVRTSEVPALKDSIEDLNSQNKKLADAKLQVEESKQSLLYLFIALFVVSLLLIFAFYNRLKSKNRHIRSLIDNQAGFQSADVVDAQADESTQPVISDMSHSNNLKAQNTANEQLEDIEPDNTPKGKLPLSFHVESFVSAGPRKTYVDEVKEGDIDLGEDITGFLISQDAAAFWVMDGTSGQDILKGTDDRLQHNAKEYFSSRLLAQNIAWNLHGIIKKYNISQPSHLLLNAAIKKTQTDWQAVIDGLGDEDRKALLKILEERKTVMCSTTIAFGILHMNKTLDLTISGDCVVITQPNPLDIPANNRRQSANIYLKEGEIHVDFNMLTRDNCTIVKQGGIEKLVAMSDGISKTTQKWISSNAKIDFSDSRIRQSLAKLKQNTQDDKSVTIVQIV